MSIVMQSSLLNGAVTIDAPIVAVLQTPARPRGLRVAGVVTPGAGAWGARSHPPIHLHLLNKGNVKKHESSKNGSTGATETQMTASGSSNENTETEATTKTQMTASGNDKITW
jgi:hypothetical protein